MTEADHPLCHEAWWRRQRRPWRAVALPHRVEHRPMRLRFPIGALLVALDIACAHGAASRFKEQAEQNAADTRRALSTPRMNAEGIYLVTPSELVRSMSQPGAAIRWIGSSVHVSGVVVHIGTSDEARVRRINDGNAFVVIGDAGTDRAARPGTLPLVVCEMDSSVAPPVAEGEPIEADGAVWGVAGPGAADVHCTSIRRP